MTLRTFQIYRYDPDKDAKPYMQTIQVELDGNERMLLDALMKLKAVDPTISFRRSCREGVCGSDAMNINGKNGLACLTNMNTLPGTIVLKPLPGLPVIRDVIVDMTQFFKQYHSIKPYLINSTIPPETERLQSPQERDELNGLYECILCASCSTACPSFWWNPDKFVGPAGLLQAYRFIADSRDEATAERLDNLEDPYRLFRCHTIMNCVDVCPKGLNPTKAIGKIKEMMVLRAVEAVSQGAPTGDQLLDERALSKLRWRCRRGLLENDLFIARFFERFDKTLNVRQAEALGVLMDLSDNDLLDLFLARKALSQVEATLDGADFHEILKMVRETR